jgi:hypothetical protein
MIPNVSIASRMWHLVAYRAGRVGERTGDDPVRVEKLATPVAADWCPAARCCGVAFVSHPWLETVAVGRESSLAFFNDLVREPHPELRAWSQLDVLRADRELSSDRIRRAFDEQLAQLRIQHRVVQEFPEFRVMPGDEGFDPLGPEVQLRHTAGQRTLHGIVWGWEV